MRVLDIAVTIAETTIEAGEQATEAENTRERNPKALKTPGDVELRPLEAVWREEGGEQEAGRDLGWDHAGKTKNFRATISLRPSLPVDLMTAEASVYFIDGIGGIRDP